MDSELVDRFRSVVFHPDGRTLRRAIRIPPGTGVDVTVEYLGLLEALGGGTEAVAGWWIGEAGEAVNELGEPDAEVVLARGSDLDLAVWRIAIDRLPELLERCRVPTLLATGHPGWVLIAPPASDDLFLYPEVSASDT